MICPLQQIKLNLKCLQHLNMQKTSKDQQKKKKGKQKETQSPSPTTTNTLEDYNIDKYKNIREWISENPSDAYWKDEIGNQYARHWLINIINQIKDINIVHIDIELKLLRRLIHDTSSPVSKEYAIMDFRFENECVHWYTTIKQGATASVNNFQALEQYTKGELPTFAQPWITYNYLLIPVAYPGNSWFIFLIDFEKWKFQVYDCSHNIHTPDAIKLHAAPVLDVVQSLLIATDIFLGKPNLRKHRNKRMNLEIIPYLPCQNNGYALS
ncbi:uncharacterized protein LOC111404535 [Olea europaea var. sylvestris]|uniref:uncharacterized protein LOC111404535 n=1 Tax=Olea europaea var. sylvestris TaxID=158386 RepID=UPI000C1D7EA9|nr:uncharacterized protein LOC111404535 [Olea europaea var. sylvestris]